MGTTTARLSENSRLGFDGIKAAVCLGSMTSNSNTASGLQPRLRRKSTGTRYTGQIRDFETGLDYFGARYYSSPLGRFTQPDPIWVTANRMIDPQRLNLYAYARNNPLKYIDPTGAELQIGDCGGYTEEECFGLLKSGLMQGDQNAIFRIEGTGDNNCSKGAICVGVVSNHKSDSVNFNALKFAADAKDIAILEGKRPDADVTSFTFSIVPIAEQLADMQLVNINPTMQNLEYMGLALFPNQFAIEEPRGLFSQDNNTRVIFRHGMSKKDTVETIYHEIQHVFLGDFGRSLPQSNHPQSTPFTDWAEAEAGYNSGR